MRNLAIALSLAAFTAAYALADEFDAAVCNGYEAPATRNECLERVSKSESEAATWPETVREYRAKYPDMEPNLLGKKLKACYDASNLRPAISKCISKSLSSESLTYSEQMAITTAKNNAAKAANEQKYGKTSSPGLTTSTKQEIINRCRDSMSNYGSAMVKACVDQDIEALNQLDKYPSNYRHFVDNCYRRMGKYGYSMVKSCADQDIEAEKALSNY